MTLCNGDQTNTSNAQGKHCPGAYEPEVQPPRQAGETIYNAQLRTMYIKKANEEKKIHRRSVKMLGGRGNVKAG